MGAPINTEHQNRHFLKPSSMAVPYLSALFLAQTDENACKRALQRAFSASAEGRRSIDVRSAADNDCKTVFNSDCKEVA